MSIKKCCENCVNTNCDSFSGFACILNGYCNFIPKEELVRADEREKVFEELSKYCQEENVKYSFQHNGNDYTITKNGYIDTFVENIRQDYKSQLIHDFRKYIDTVIKDYNSTCGKPDEYEH